MSIIMDATNGITTGGIITTNANIENATITNIGNISNAELDFLNGVSSNIQTQINSKSPINNPTFSGGINTSSTIASEMFSVVTYNKSMTITTSAQNIFSATDNILVTGTYLVKINSISDYLVHGAHYGETYCGIMQWYNEGTNSDVADTIPLHRMGHAPNWQTYYLRTLRNGASCGTFQIWGAFANSGSYTYNFTFKRIG